MTIFPSSKKFNRPAGSSDNLLSGETASDPLLTSAISTTKISSLNEGEDISDVDLLLAVGEGAVKIKKKRRPRRGEDFTFREAIVKAYFWLLWLVYFLGVGSGVTVLNNFAQIGGLKVRWEATSEYAGVCRRGTVEGKERHQPT
ncbi:hypothetical protein L6452_09563 [Arctium lappa]|uniref:Uncharacterized protein n=1 Tax=Arctium lappa TaxID=4217 RepID=A0ACB9DLJ7_ARCLA|nr:hypothetical protein L6452_09563 [Arctium lappa]